MRILLAPASATSTTKRSGIHELSSWPCQDFRGFEQFETGVSRKNGWRRHHTKACTGIWTTALIAHVHLQREARNRPTVHVARQDASRYPKATPCAVDELEIPRCFSNVDYFEEAAMENPKAVALTGARACAETSN